MTKPNRFSALLLSAACLLYANAAAAQTGTAQGFTFEANATKSEDLEGGELGVGYHFALSWFRLTPMVGTLIYKGDNDRYRQETLSNGNEICRDLTNGQFAKKEKCDDAAFKAYGKLEAAVRVGEALELGGGVRVSDEARPYGMIAFNASEQFALQGFYGKEYYGAGLRVRF